MQIISISHSLISKSTTMKHSLLTLLMLATTASLPAQAQDGQPSMLVGYCGDTSVDAIGSPLLEDDAFAVYFDDAFTQKYAGCKVTAVAVMWGSTYGINNSIFITPTLSDGPLPATYPIQQEVKDDPMPFTWDERPLDQPFTIEAGKPFYAGARTTPVKEWGGIYYFSVEEAEDASHSLLYDPETQKWKSPAAFPPYAADIDYTHYNFLLKLRITGNSLPTGDIAISDVSGPDYSRVGEIKTFSYTVTNKAATPVSGFDLVWSEQGTELGRATLNAVLPAQQSKSFTQDILCDREGAHTLTFTVIPAGTDDPNPADNAATALINVFDTYFDRNVLVEGFTTMQCANCPIAHEREDEAFGTLANVVRVDHHSGFGTDRLTTDADKAFTWFYNENGTTWAPGIMFDRTNLYGFYDAATAFSPLVGPGDVETLLDIHTRQAAVPAFVRLTLTPSYDPATRQLTLDVATEQLGILPCSDCRLNVWLTEDGILSSSVGQGQMLSTGQQDKNYVHNNVMRATLTGTWGTAHDNTDGSRTQTFTATLDTAWNPANMHAIAFIANYNATDPCDCTVCNAATAPLLGAEGITPSPLSTANSQLSTAYDLQGRAINAPVKGVSILGGQKVLR